MSSIKPKLLLQHIAALCSDRSNYPGTVRSHSMSDGYQRLMTPDCIMMIVMISVSHITSRVITDVTLWYSVFADAGATQKSRPSTKKSQSQAPEPAPPSRRPGPGSPAAPRSEARGAPASPASAPSSQCQQPDLVKFTVSDAAHAAQHSEIDRLERLMESHVAHVSRLERRHAENMAGCEVMSLVLSNISQKVRVTRDTTFYPRQENSGLSLILPLVDLQQSSSQCRLDDGSQDSAVQARNKANGSMGPSVTNCIKFRTNTKAIVLSDLGKKIWTVSKINPK